MQYVYHPYYVDAIAMRINASGDEHYYLQDANFNVTAVTDDAGAVVERYAYTPYGEATIMDASFTTRASSLITNEYLYTGRRLDPETGLQSNRLRFLHLQLGRWLTQDPLRYVGSPWNLFEYVEGNPILFADAFGLVIDSVSARIWSLIWSASYDAALDTVDDALMGASGKYRKQLQALSSGIKQIKNLTKWRTQWAKSGLKKLRQQLKKLRKTFKQHLKKYGGDKTGSGEVVRIDYQVQWLEKEICRRTK